MFNMLLQIMEEGRLTDSFGRNVDFRNTISDHDQQPGCGPDQGRRPGSASRSCTEAADYDNIKVVLAKEIERVSSGRSSSTVWTT